MLRKPFLRLCKGAGAAVVGGTVSGDGRVSEELERKTNDVFSIRRAPKSLFEETMHSNTLTDHPLTHRTSRDELAYRKRKLTERGNYEQAAKAEEEAERRDVEGRAGAETREYYSAICFVVLGYLTAHAVVFNKFYPDDLRPNYSPDRGYSDDVAARRQDLEAVDELVGLSVLEGVFSKQKAFIKRQMA
ncbi:uncharacterized protein TM35_000142790 [Trypanosoma theileri]|uniref:Uncharacterized protein n=1 Tax=Trypanosoma theileri TaxID=67003 RepID=A0A1X0NWZ6_9TRYP|nr:uncharacterized protein TM35_000142790 [Trypanosoma theileri]ORC89068.1 hypothetical protein TM35_000142790 [Trypanosoma theileri]